MRRFLTVAGSLLMLAGGFAIVVFALFNVSGPDQRTLPEPEAFSVPTQAPTEIPPSPEPTPAPSSAPIERLLIPRIGVDAPIVVLGVTPDGVMQDPKGPMEVAWYDFSSYPGFGSNAVFAGHVDYANFGAAVFWKLRELQAGDEINVRLTDGTRYTYRVISSNTFSAQDAPVQDIVGSTPQEVVTLITCGGTFNTRTREYDRRLIVRAERDPGATATSARIP